MEWDEVDVEIRPLKFYKRQSVKVQRFTGKLPLVVQFKSRAESYANMSLYTLHNRKISNAMLVLMKFSLGKNPLWNIFKMFKYHVVRYCTKMSEKELNAEVLPGRVSFGFLVWICTKTVSIQSVQRRDAVHVCDTLSRTFVKRTCTIRIWKSRYMWILLAYSI